MKKQILSGILAVSMTAGLCVLPVSAEEPAAPEVIFEENFAGEDGQDLALAACNGPDDNYFDSDFYLNYAPTKLSERADRLEIKKEFGDTINTIRRTHKDVSGVGMSTLQAPFKTLREENKIVMAPSEKTVYYVKWKEYIQAQPSAPGGFAVMSNNNNFNACMLDFGTRAGGGIGRIDQGEESSPAKLKPFVSFNNTSTAVTFAEKELLEDTWYDLVLRIEANPGTTPDIMSLKVYPTGQEPSGDFDVVGSLAANATYTQARYYFKADICTGENSDMAISGPKGERFTGAAVASVETAESAVKTLEAAPTKEHLEVANTAVAAIAADSIAYGLLYARAAAVEENIREEAGLKDVAIQGKTDVKGAVVYAACAYETPGLANTSFQWYRDGAVIDQAVNQTYTITAEDIGKTLTVKATDSETVLTSEAVTISDDGGVLADETAIEADARLADYAQGFASGWRLAGSEMTMSSSTELASPLTVSNNMLQFNCTGKKYVRALAAPIDTNSDCVYYITWTQDALAAANKPAASIQQKFELGGAEESVSELVFGVNCNKDASIGRFTGLYKRGTGGAKFPAALIYPGDKYRGILRIDASSQENEDAVYYKYFRENPVVQEPAAWNVEEKGITFGLEKLDKLLVQSSYAAANSFGGLKIERYQKREIQAVDAAIASDPETAKTLIAALPEGMAKNDLSAKLNGALNKGVTLTADKAKLEAQGETGLQITIVNKDAVYYKTAKLITAEYDGTGRLIKAEFTEALPMQEQTITKQTVISGQAAKAKILFFESIDSLRVMGEAIELTR